MVYIVFNILLSISLIFFTTQVNKKIKDQTISVYSISVAMLFSVIASVIFSILLIVKEFGYETFIQIGMRVVFVAEGIALISLGFTLIEMGTKKIYKVASVIKILLIFLVGFIVFFKIDEIVLTRNYGIKVYSDTIFDGLYKYFFAITWYDLYNALTKIIVPMVCILFLSLVQERRNVTQLEKYQTTIIFASFILMWLIYSAIRYISTAVLNTSYLYMFSYSYMYIIIYMALTKTTVPSGRATLVSLFKVLVSYILPAIVVGALVAYFQPVVNSPKVWFIIGFSIFGGLIIYFAINLSYLMSSSTKLYTADYGAGLEKELATVEYREVDMDYITEKMYEILKKNAETSSLNVYIISGKGEVETAYSSNKLKLTIPINNQMFDTLLNIDKNIVVYSEIDKEHSLYTIQNELRDFFDYTKSDALFILNEGHNIFGLITLGKRVTGDHFKSYDYNVFEKLYSYFFVFGYYMRNIANKDIIGIVNREIRMSSQIITSIQENIDRVKSTKVDIGYLMVPAHNIGGEFIDLIRLTDTRHLFVVGDLSGKGIGASMNMVILKSIIRTHLAEIHDFKELVVRLNTFVRDSLPKGTIFSGLFALIDFETDTMYYINCGIPALMMYTQVYNNVIEIQGSGHILGFVKDISPYISVKTTKLNPGDILLACTDGLVRSHSLRGEQFGKERVQQAVLDNASYNAQRMAQFTFDGLVKFMTKEMEDDVSILVIKYEGLPTEKKVTEDTNKVVLEDKEINVSEAEDVSNLASEGKSDVGEEAVVAEQSSEIEESTAIVNDESMAEVDNSSMGVESMFLSDDEKKIDGADFEMPDMGDIDQLIKEAGL